MSAHIFWLELRRNYPHPSSSADYALLALVLDQTIHRADLIVFIFNFFPSTSQTTRSSCQLGREDMGSGPALISSTTGRLFLTAALLDPRNRRTNETLDDETDDGFGAPAVAARAAADALLVCSDTEQPGQGHPTLSVFRLPYRPRPARCRVAPRRRGPGLSVSSLCIVNG